MSEERFDAVGVGVPGRHRGRYAAFREQNSQRPFGANFAPHEVDALSVSAAEERTREFEERWQVGGRVGSRGPPESLISWPVYDRFCASVRRPGTLSSRPTRGPDRHSRTARPSRPACSLRRARHTREAPGVGAAVRRPLLVTD